MWIEISTSLPTVKVTLALCLLLCEIAGHDYLVLTVHYWSFRKWRLTRTKMRTRKRRKVKCVFDEEHVVSEYNEYNGSYSLHSAPSSFSTKMRLHQGEWKDYDASGSSETWDCCSSRDHNCCKCWILDVKITLNKVEMKMSWFFIQFNSLLLCYCRCPAGFSTSSQK